MKQLVVLLVLLSSLVQKVYPASIFEEEVNGIKFHGIVPILNVGGFVYHIDHDQYVPGNILFSTNNQLITANINNKTASRIIGKPYTSGYAEGDASQAKFNGISSFYHLTTSSLLIIDQKNHVLRVVNRSTQQSSLFAGIANSNDTRDGSLTRCSFYKPFDLATFDGEIFYISQFGKSYFAIMNLGAGEGNVRHREISAAAITSLSANFEDGTLLAVAGAALLNIDPSDMATTTIVGGSPRSIKDGSFQEAAFVSIGDVLRLKNDTLIVTGYLSSNLRVIDLNGRVTSICSKSGNGANIDNCTLKEPSCIFRYNSSLVLIGTTGRIMGLQVEGIVLPTTTAPETTPTTTTPAEPTTLSATEVTTRSPPPTPTTPETPPTTTTLAEPTTLSITEVTTRSPPPTPTTPETTSTIPTSAEPDMQSATTSTTEVSQPAITTPKTTTTTIVTTELPSPTATASVTKLLNATKTNPITPNSTTVAQGVSSPNISNFTRKDLRILGSGGNKDVPAYTAIGVLSALNFIAITSGIF